MKHIFRFLTTMLFWAVTSPYTQAQYDRLPLKNDICDKIVIGDFTCDNCTSADATLAQDYRDEVGGVLTKYRYCNVIERDRLADILKKNQNEAVISSIDRLTLADRLELTNLTQAKRIIFGTLKFQTDRSLVVTLEIANLETSQSELKYKFEIPENAVQIFSKRQVYMERSIQELLLGKDAGAELQKPVIPEETAEQPPADDKPPVVTDPELPSTPPAAPETPFVIQGPIREKWISLGGKNGPLGNVTGNEKPTPDRIGRFNDFEKGAIYWTPTLGAHALGREIREKWGMFKWEAGPFGYPITDETPAFDGIGRFVHFERASIYWSPKTGAHEVHGSIRDKWAALGWAKGILGYPITDETPTPDKIGRFNHFERGSIYWTPKTGAHEVHGTIRDLWAKLGWETGILGYPITSETPTPDKIGRFNHFEHGSIYWTPQTGTHEVHGSIRDLWAKLGWEKGRLGYPTSDERPSAKCPGCRENTFQHGTIYWSGARGAWVE